MELHSQIAEFENEIIIVIDEKDLELEKVIGQGYLLIYLYTIFFNLIIDLLRTFGNVFKGQLNDSCVALKQLKNLNEITLEQVKAEANIMRKFRHKHIVFMYGFVEIRGTNQIYLAMEYLEKGDLKHLIQHEELSASMKVDLLFQICLGMEFLHQKGVIHRDLKVIFYQFIFF